MNSKMFLEVTGGSKLLSTCVAIVRVTGVDTQMRFESVKCVESLITFDILANKRFLFGMNATVVQAQGI